MTLGMIGPLEKSMPANSDEIKEYRKKIVYVRTLLKKNVPVSKIAAETGLTYAAVRQYAFANKYID